MPGRVLLDTCVLYPPTLRDTLLRLAKRSHYQPIWSADILDELRRNVTRSGIAPSKVDRLFSEMRLSFDAAEITGYHHLIDTMGCHPKDRHVLAAAVHGEAPSIVTFNLRDFPRPATAPLGLRVLHPDDFLLESLCVAPAVVLEVLERQAVDYRRPSTRLPRVLDALDRTGLGRFAVEVRRLIT